MESLSHFLYSAALVLFVAAGFILRSNHLGKYLSSFGVFVFPRPESKNSLEASPLKTRKTATPLVPSYSIDWWKHESLFQLEKRAIFSKTWLFVTHACRFRKAGDYRTFEIVGFSIIVILGKDNQLRAFQNVCRHRAYQVAKKECGSSMVLGCRYHGWSYDTKGKLIKAPEFENVPNFDKNQNSLWEVKLETRNGFVFINMESTEHTQTLHLDDSETAIASLRSSDLKCVGEWKIEGRFNWKLADISLLPNQAAGIPSWLTFSRFTHREGVLGHTAVFKSESSGSLLTLRFLPNHATSTTVDCTFYKESSADHESEFASLKKAVQDKIKDLEQQQKRLLLGRNNRNLAEEMTSASFDQQTEIRKILKTHADAEHKLGEEIYPAAQSQSVTSEGKRDDDFCRDLGVGEGRRSVCSASAQGLLDW
ncbi:hypothetical protein HYFRA_00001938 [Hymenoscyphus fraxineus]|uniref:Rieske domain-containing protein n=1 Tax=Hymenoscyphus fraxineus TaxID=746836 RepID=A0A9N9PMD4_9HELO|nr:hypothetical protein HYFRA_00001938 [Hymenoscyphus fraxineus]